MRDDLALPGRRYHILDELVHVSRTAVLPLHYYLVQVLGVIGSIECHIHSLAYVYFIFQVLHQVYSHRVGFIVYLLYGFWVNELQLYASVFLFQDFYEVSERRPIGFYLLFNHHQFD